MIKPSTILLLGSIVVTCIFGVPKFRDLKFLYISSKNLNSATDSLKNTIADIEPQLDDLKSQYKDVNLSTNYDIALTVSNLPGVKMNSITSLITKDGKLFECSEVATVDDVNFFNDSTEEMRFKMKLKDRDSFLKALIQSPLVVRELDLDEKKKTVVLTVDTVFHGGEAIENG